MNRQIRTISKVSLAAGVAAVVACATITLATPRTSGCWRPIMCNDVWDPVICDDGRIYSNDCYAYRACATGCVPYGERPGPVPLP